MTMTTSPVDNGVNSEALMAARQALSDAPEAAEFTWRGRHIRTRLGGSGG
jgi:hypothetical protein